MPPCRIRNQQVTRSSRVAGSIFTSKKKSLEGTGHRGVPAG
jgi:hypothetical protein